MNAQEIDQATNALVQATEQAAVDAGTSAEARQEQLVPGIASGSNEPGGYMYARHIAPVVPALTTELVTQAKQNILRGAIRDNLYTAQKGYEDAQFAYRQRQRDYEKEQARRAKERRLAAERAQAAYGGGGGGYGPSGGDGLTFAGVNQIPGSGSNQVKVTPGSSGVFWRGANGQVYVKGGKGTNAAGSWDKNTSKYWAARGFKEIADPNPPRIPIRGTILSWPSGPRA